jgi:hypothetical protein
MGVDGTQAKECQRNRKNSVRSDANGKGDGPRAHAGTTISKPRPAIARQTAAPQAAISRKVAGDMRESDDESRTNGIAFGRAMCTHLSHIILSL